MRLLVAMGLALAPMSLVAAPALAFDGFGALSDDSTYGVEMEFNVELAGGAPDRLELLVRFPGSGVDIVVPVQPSGDRATYTWETAADYVPPNSRVAYRWRAENDGVVTVSAEATLLYEDDRPGLDWQTARIGDATVHWYGDVEAQARRFGELTALGVDQGEALLGTQLAGPVDILVYATREHFFGALAPIAREWTGAAVYPENRTILMWLQGGTPNELEAALVHEVTHVVFFDATQNPFHEPARWLNEGIATWSETGDANAERALVELEAGGGGLFAFEAIAEQFPVSRRGGILSYAQGTVFVDMIVERHGRDAIARIAAAYREGTSDAEALEAGTGVQADTLYREFFASFGVEPPQPVEPGPILPSNVAQPPGVDGGPAGTTPAPQAPTIPGARPGEPGGDAADALVLIALGLAALGALGLAVALDRRATRRERAR